MKKMVYIILVNWNGWKDTIECLESIYCNMYENYKVIICDNNSSDNSLENIERWVQGKLTYNITNLSNDDVSRRKEIKLNVLKAENEKASEDSNLILIQTGENLGFGFANNIGIHYANSCSDMEYIWILNNDTVIDQNALIELVHTYNRFHKPGIIGSKIFEYYRPESLFAFAGYDHGVLNRIGRRINTSMINTDKYDEDIIIKGFISGTSMFMDRNVAEKVVGFDENYFMYVEEVDLCKRVSDLGYLLIGSGKSKIWHKEGASVSDERKSVFRPTTRGFIMWGYYEFRNRYYYMKKFHSKILSFYFIVHLYFFLRRSIGVIYFNDKNKFLRIKVLFKGFYDGFFGKMGKRINPSDFNSKK